MTWEDLLEWIKLVARWVHVFAAILWIGQTYLFNFFEGNLEPDERENVAGNLWMVHGGGFYYVEKQKTPEMRPQTLHWFKWEAFTTWVSGAVLIGLTYYVGGLLVEPEMDYWMGAAAGLGGILFGWLVYDLLARFWLDRSEAIFGLFGFALIMVCGWLFTELLSSRAVYIHVGAVLGTIMAANVWMRILPAQRRMIALAEAGKSPDRALAATGPQRSRHNSFLVVPVVFLMISNHYPTISYGNDHSLILLGIMVLVGWAAAAVMRRM